MLEFASADAVRRGGNGPRPPKNDPAKKPFETSHRGGDSNRSGIGRGDHPHGKRAEVVQQSEMVAATGDGENREKDGARMNAGDAQERPHKRARDSRDASNKRRPKPGAALALAQREKVAIVPSEGKKIKF